MCIFWTVCFAVIYRLKQKSLLEKNVKRRGWMQGFWFDAHWILRVDEASGFVCASCSVFYWSHCRLLMFSLSGSSLQTAANAQEHRQEPSCVSMQCFSVPPSWPSLLFNQAHAVRQREGSLINGAHVTRMSRRWAGGAVATEPCQK